MTIKHEIMAPSWQGGYWVPRRFDDYAWTPRTVQTEVLYLATSALLLCLAVAIGWQQGQLWQTFPLLGTSIALEAQPGAAASIALGFHPLAGGLISIFGNLLPIPLLLVSFRQVIRRWHWARTKIARAQNWAKRYGRYGVGVLFFLSPFLGAYVCIAIGYAMGARPIPTLAATLGGMVASVALIVYGGPFIVSLI